MVAPNLARWGETAISLPFSGSTARRTVGERRDPGRDHDDRGWRPGVSRVQHGRMGAYREAYERSITDPDGFWRDASAAVDWTRPPTRVLDADHPPFYRWFPDAELNTCHNALDRHVAAGHGERTALVYDSPVTGTLRKYTYRNL